MANFVDSYILLKDGQTNETKEKIIKMLQKKGGEEGEASMASVIPRPKFLEMGNSGWNVSLDVEYLSNVITEENYVEHVIELCHSKFNVEVTKTEVENFVNSCITDDCDKSQAIYSSRFALNMLLYGFGDWFQWSIMNWGTKWDFEPNGSSLPDLVFQTPWAPPIPVYQKVCDMLEEDIIILTLFDCNIDNDIITQLHPNMPSTSLSLGGNIYTYDSDGDLKSNENVYIKFNECLSKLWADEHPNYIADIVDNFR